MRSTGGPALETLVRRALERHPTCGVASGVLQISPTAPAALQQIRDLMAPVDDRFECRVALLVPLPRPTGARSAHLRDGAEDVATVHAGALVATVAGSLNGAGNHLDPMRFWRHCVTVGLLARLVARDRAADESSSFAAGFLYPIGRLFLDRLCDGQFGDVLRRCHGRGFEVNEAEHLVIGASEAELGAMLALRWGFPAWLVDAIGYPRTPKSAPFQTVSTIGSVFPARLAAATLGIGTEVEEASPVPAHLRWLADPVLLSVGALGGTHWLTTHVDGILASAFLGERGSAR